MREYKRVSDAPHVVATEEALKHWDKRRSGDLVEGVPAQNIKALTGRVEALLRALAWLSDHGLSVADAHVLDVGAASGYGLRPFLLGGFSLSQLHGIDLFADRASHGMQILPGLDVITGDATAMPYEPSSFDLVCAQFCFCHIPDATAKQKIATEMMRVTKRFILFHDWRLGSEKRKLYGAGQGAIKQWFPDWRIAARFRSQLWPIGGRPLSKHAPVLYDLARALNPLVGSWLYVLQR